MENIIIIYKFVQLTRSQSALLSHHPPATGGILSASADKFIYIHLRAHKCEQAPFAADTKHIDKTSNSQYWLLEQVKFHASAGP